MWPKKDDSRDELPWICLGFERVFVFTWFLCIFYYDIIFFWRAHSGLPWFMAFVVLGLYKVRLRLGSSSGWRERCEFRTDWILKKRQQKKKTTNCLVMWLSGKWVSWLLKLSALWYLGFPHSFQGCEIVLPYYVYDGCESGCC